MHKLVAWIEQREIRVLSASEIRNPDFACAQSRLHYLHIGETDAEMWGHICRS
jgi:hypothetical protein